MNASLHKRAKQIRTHATIRGWEYRQRHHAKRVWFRLRRVLAEAEVAYTITEADALQLLLEGCVPEPVGAELEPTKRILFVPIDRINRIEQKHPIPLILNAELLAERNLVLVRWPDKDFPSSECGVTE